MQDIIIKNSFITEKNIVEKSEYFPQSNQQYKISLDLRNRCLEICSIIGENYYISISRLDNFKEETTLLVQYLFGFRIDNFGKILDLYPTNTLGNTFIDRRDLKIDKYRMAYVIDKDFLSQLKEKKIKTLFQEEFTRDKINPIFSFNESLKRINPKLCIKWIKLTLIKNKYLGDVFIVGISKRVESDISSKNDFSTENDIENYLISIASLLKEGMNEKY